MSKAIVSCDIRSLIDQWMQAEQDGEQFPVPLHDYWMISGHNKKQDAILLLESILDKGSDYLRSTVKNGKRGRPTYTYFVTCDALKHWALASQTEEGRLIRQYFIESEKKWKLVEKVDPVFAQQIEIMKLQAEISRNNRIISDNQRYLTDKHDLIRELHGSQMLALIQGRPDAVVEKIEKVTETVICRDGRNVSFVGKSTAELGKELGFKTGKELERWLTQHKRQDLICEGLRAVQAPYIPSEHIQEVKRLWSQTRKTNGTQLMLGE